MRHRKAGVKLNRSSSHRKAMFRNMVTSLFKHDRIKTTDTRAKELSRWADHIITLAKRGDLHSRRQALAIVREKAIVHKIFEEAQERFGKRNGGYTRVVKLGRRPGDAALISMIELISADDQPVKKKKKVKTPPAKIKAEKAQAETVASDTADKEIDAKADAQQETADDSTETEAAPAADEVEASTVQKDEDVSETVVEASSKDDASVDQEAQSSPEPTEAEPDEKDKQTD